MKQPACNWVRGDNCVYVMNLWNYDWWSGYFTDVVHNYCFHDSASITMLFTVCSGKFWYKPNAHRSKVEYNINHPPTGILILHPKFHEFVFKFSCLYEYLALHEKTSVRDWFQIFVRVNWSLFDTFSETALKTWMNAKPDLNLGRTDAQCSILCV